MISSKRPRLKATFSILTFQIQVHKLDTSFESLSSLRACKYCCALSRKPCGLAGCLWDLTVGCSLSLYHTISLHHSNNHT